MSKTSAPARDYAPGIGEAVANRTINRDIVQPYQRRQTIKATLAWDSDHDLDGVTTKATLTSPTQW